MALANNPQLEVKRTLLDKILQDCLGLSIVTTIPKLKWCPAKNSRFVKQ